ncbi:conserved hypothetical tiny transmembrane protein [Ornithinibacillus halophilus]|uniref:Conserved hypothetical tiny transmembrane protein n=1 Tax=Ornithinibacillus halophilus TaxID=930117 RepID=A0A1M5N2X6_9BACI|nr:conserved hypothetical tiny transmembrane protein [Ornithinibacillus halophilus]
MHYGHCDQNYSYGYGAPVYNQGGGFGNGFALIVVLFILLIIVGAAWL